MLHDVDILAGFHAVEHDDRGPFLWTEGEFEIRLIRAARFARLTLCYYGDEGTLSVRSARGLANSVPLCRGWHECAVSLGGAAAGEIIQCQVTPIVRVPTDTRELGVMLRDVELFDDDRSFELLSKSRSNLQVNQGEYREGRTVLSSLPPALRVSIETRCNIPETSQACVYCSWDFSKEAERGSSAFTLDTFDELGDFYDSAIEIIDCSVGEPTMNKEFGAIVAQADRDGKQFSLTTNGQLLTPRLRREIVGRNVLVHVSIDSATAAGYARYRNDRFDDVIANLTALCREKKAHRDLPRVYVSFIAMRSNVAELPAFVALMKQVGVDEIKMRSLNLDDHVTPVSVKNGYRFDYADEVLTMDELARVAQEPRALARQHGVAMYVEWEQFVVDVAQPGGPACDEPWRTMWFLRRGIMPCCYATEPIARWEDRDGRPLAEFLRDVFNGPAFQDIRGELAAGRLSEYCRNTPSCPILKRKQQQGLIQTQQNAYQRRALASAPPRDKPELPLVPLEALGRRTDAA